MDPNAALKKIRESIVSLEGLTLDDKGIVAEEIAENFEALDEWITKGGFPPRDWDWSRR